ncbi:hypothetical protein ABK040_005883 [Willaertia magna]
MSTEEEINKIKAFNEWMKESHVNAYKHESIDIKYISKESGLGGLLTDNLIASDDNEITLLSIPLSICLNFRNMSDTFKEFVKYLEELDKNFTIEEKNVKEDELNSIQWKGTNMFENRLIIFYLFLIYETFINKENSKYFPYLNLLPKIFNTSIYFNEKELLELKGTNLLKSTISIKEKLNKIYTQKVYNLLQNIPFFTDIKEIFTFERFCWAFSCVWSRVFPITYAINNQTSNITTEIVPTLLPVVDILNHKFNSKITYKTENETFYLNCRENLQKGQEVCNNYGAKSNDSFLLSYGFVMRENPEDSLYVQIGMMGNAEGSFTNNDSSSSLVKSLVEMKKSYLRENQLVLGHYLKKNKIPEEFFQTLRICVMEEDEFYFVKNKTMEEHLELRKLQKEYNSSYFFSIKNEYNMLMNLKLLFNQKKLQLVPTTIEEDENLLNNNDLDYNMRNILIYRIGQKKIIEFVLNEINLRLSKLLGENQSYIYLEDNNIITDNNLDILKNYTFIENNCNKFNIVLKDNYFKLHTSNTINENELLFTINLNNLINFNNISKTVFYSFIEKAKELEQNRMSVNDEDELILDDAMTIMLFIIVECFSQKYRTGQFEMFFKDLKSISFSPLIMISNKILENELDGFSLLDEVIGTKSSLRHCFKQVLYLLKQIGFTDEEGIFTMENYLFAYVVFDLFNIGNDTLLPIPAIPQYLQFKFEFTEENVHVKSICEIPSKVELTFSLLSFIKSIDDLMIRYGPQFIDKSIILTQCKFPIEVDIESIQSLITKEKLQLLNQFKNNNFCHYLKFGQDIYKLKEMFGILYLEDIQVLQYIQYPDLKLQLDKQTVKLVKHTVQNLLSGILHGFETTIEEDTKIIQSSTNKALEMIIYYRLIMKQLLEYALRE